MFHVSVTYRGLRAVGMFLEPDRWEEVVGMRAAGRHGVVPALDAEGRPTSIVVHELVEDPEVLGVGAEPLADRVSPGPAPTSRRPMPRS